MRRRAFLKAFGTGALVAALPRLERQPEALKDKALTYRLPTVPVPGGEILVSDGTQWVPIDACRFDGYDWCKHYESVADVEKRTITFKLTNL